MPEEYDDDLDLDDETDEESGDTLMTTHEDGTTTEVPVKPQAKEKPAEPDAQQQQLAELGLAALKQGWVEAAKAAGSVAADFDGIGLKGIDDAAKAAFLAEAAASHTAKVEALAAQGFVYNPGAAQAAEQDEREAALRQAWGQPGPGQVASGDEKFDAQVKDEVAKGDVMGVIGSLLGPGKMGEFFVRGRR